MKLTASIFVSLLVAVECSLHQRYDLPPPGSYGRPTIDSGTPPEGEIQTFITGVFNPHASIQRPVAFEECGVGEVRQFDGRCVTPEVMRNIYIYNIPEQQRPVGPPPNVPPPKVEHNILFVRLPENAGGLDPIIVPPPQQKNIVYVLNKGTDIGGQKVITVPAPPKSQPEVYFVNYGDGQNPTLPGGVDLQTALNSAVHQGLGQVIGSGPGGEITYGGTSSGSNHHVSGGSPTSGGIGHGSIIDGGIIDGGIISGGVSYTPPGLYTS